MLKLFQNVRYIRNAYQESKQYTLAIVILNVLAGCMPALKVLAVGKLIDDVLRLEALGRQRIVLDACLVAGVYLLEYMLTALHRFLNTQFTIRLNNGMEDKFYAKLSQMKYAVLEDNDSNDLIFQVKDGIEQKFADGFSKILEFAGLIFNAASILAVVLAKSVWTGVILLIVFVCLVPLYRKLGEDNYEAYAEANKEYRRARNYRQILTEREYANERELFGYSAFFNQKWKERYLSAVQKSEKASRQNHFLILTVTGAVAALTTLLSSILIPALRSGAVSLGVYVVIVTQLFNLVHFMSWNFSYIVDDLSENSLYLKDFDAYMKLAAVTEPQKGKSAPKACIRIRVENLSFRYPGCEEYVLKNVSFEFQEGKHYAIVGKNGAGKTTLIKLLLGLYDAYEGDIFINDTNMREMTPAEIHSVFSVVFQDFAKYAMTVKENILLSYSDHSEMVQKAETVLVQLGMMDDIQQLKKGLDTSLGKVDEDGVDLSGGQWQKIALARGAVSDACVYILDEPSSSLDPISERNLYGIYNDMFKRNTTILITHRLGNTKNQDEILVLDGGRLAEHGNHNELMKRGAVYYDMYVKQRSWYGEERA